MHEFREPTDAELDDKLDEESRKFAKRYEDFEPGSIPVASDGGPTPGFGAAPPVVAPPFETTSLCMAGPRGQCRHHWRVVSSAPAGNAPGTWEHLKIPEPKAHFHTCLAQPGRETELDDDTIFECNRYEPLPLLVQIRTKVGRISQVIIELLKKEI
jgi:hypothetical protein